MVPARVRRRSTRCRSRPTARSTARALARARARAAAPRRLRRAARARSRRCSPASGPTCFEPRARRRPRRLLRARRPLAPRHRRSSPASRDAFGVELPLRAHLRGAHGRRRSPSASRRALREGDGARGAAHRARAARRRRCRSRSRRSGSGSSTSSSRASAVVQRPARRCASRARSTSRALERALARDRAPPRGAAHHLRARSTGSPSQVVHDERRPRARRSTTCRRSARGRARGRGAPRGRGRGARGPSTSRAGPLLRARLLAPRRRGSRAPPDAAPHRLRRLVAGRPRPRARARSTTPSAPAQPSPLPELPVQYADYAAWQRALARRARCSSGSSPTGRRSSRARPPALDLPTDRPRPPVPSHRGARRAVRAARARSPRALAALARREGATLFMTLLAAFDVLLYRYTGQDDLVVGTPIAGRTRAETEGLIGFFVNTLVAPRATLAGEPPFRELLAPVREACLGAYAHQDCPSSASWRSSRPSATSSRSPLFQVMFTLQNAPRRGARARRASRVAASAPRAATAKFDLTLALARGAARARAAALEYSDRPLRRGHHRADGRRTSATLLEGVVARARRAPSASCRSSPTTSAAGSLVDVERHRGRATPRDALRPRALRGAGRRARRTPSRVALRGRDAHLRASSTRAPTGSRTRSARRGVGPGRAGRASAWSARSRWSWRSSASSRRAAPTCRSTPSTRAERLAFMLEDARPRGDPHAGAPRRARCPTHGARGAPPRRRRRTRSPPSRRARPRAAALTPERPRLRDLHLGLDRAGPRAR